METRKYIPSPARIQRWISVVLRFVIAGAAVFAAFQGNWAVLIASLISLGVLLILPVALERGYRIQLPVEFELAATLFLYAALTLGSVHGYYTRFWWWDLALHAGSGLALGFIGFLILYALRAGKRLSMSPFLLVVFSFAFSMAIGAVWEIAEFALDSWFALGMQAGGLPDTMWDLVVDAGGALVASIAGYMYLHLRSPGITRYLVSAFLKKNPQFKIENE